MKPASFYEYVSESGEREEPWRKALGHTVAPRYDLAAELRAPRSAGDNLRMVRDWARYAAARWRGHRVLLKDPLAFFSAPWIARRFDAQVLVVTRHPAAFASSLLRLDWRFEFGAWLDQPALMSDVLAPWRSELEAARRDPGDVLDQAALVWKVIAEVTRRYRDERPDWIFVRHEDLSRDPEAAFRELCSRLGLAFGSAMQRVLRETTSAENPVEAPADAVHAFARNSRDNASLWKSRLSARQVQRLRAQVGPAADAFYDASDW